MRLLIVIATAGALTACVGPTTQAVRTTLTMNFDPPQRRAVWGRAVNSFNIAGILISTADSSAGVLRSQGQGGITPCSNSVWPDMDSPAAGLCYESRITQFTISDDGVAVLRVNRVVHGQSRVSGNLLNDQDQLFAHKEVEDLLRFIVGKSKEMPAPPARSAGRRDTADAI